MKTKLNWGILGGGLFANDCVAPAILQSKNANLSAVYSRSKLKAEQFANKFNIPNCYDNKTDFFENPEIDVVYISTPNTHHFHDVIAAAKSKKHIFCEKPMCTSLEEAYEIKETCEINKVQLGLDFGFEFHPFSVMAKEWVKKGKIGDIYLAKSNFIFQLPGCEKINPWRFNPELSGGGAVIEVGCHCIDILNFLLEKNVVRVSATINQPRFKAPSESTGIIMMTYEDNCLGLVTVSNDIPGAGPFGAGFELHGNKGSIIGLGNLGRYPTGKLIFRDKSGQEEVISLPQTANYQIFIDEIESFSNSILNHTFFHSNLNNGINNMKIIIAAYTSAEQQQTLTLK